MYSRMDEYFIHQTIDTVDHVATSDPRFQDRLYFTIHGHAPEVQLSLGVGCFPNMNVMGLVQT